MNEIIKHNQRSYWMGWAMIFIILCHIQYTCFDGSIIMIIMQSIFIKGEFGVDVFLFLSIIGLCYSIENHGLIDFYTNRAKRIFPMYFIFLFFSFLFYKSADNILIDIIYQISGLAIFTGNKLEEWYIPATITLYLSFPLLFYFIKKLYQKNIIYCILLIILLIYVYPVTKLIVIHFFARRLYLIPLGITIYLSHTRNSGINIIVLLSFVALLQLFIPLKYAAYLYVPLLLVLFDMYLKKLPLYKFTSWIGRHSLEIYLGQTLGFIFFCNQVNFNPTKKIIMGSIITITSSIIMYWGHSLFLKTIKRKGKQAYK